MAMRTYSCETMTPTMGTALTIVFCVVFFPMALLTGLLCWGTLFPRFGCWLDAKLYGAFPRFGPPLPRRKPQRSEFE